jgi:predicted phage terminase large subunit-like protein
MAEIATKKTKGLSDKEKHIVAKAMHDPVSSIRKMVSTKLIYFIRYFWSEYSAEELEVGWHMEYICDELEEVAKRVGNNEPKKYDLIINVPPGTSKTSIVNIFFPVWCWVNWYHLRFITGSYASALALESAEYSRDIVRSEKFKQLFPELEIKDDKDTKSNFKVIKKLWLSTGRVPRLLPGGNRLSTSTGGSSTGFHAHILIVDDPLDPRRSYSKVELDKANRWVGETLSTRKVNKRVTPLILIMQRLHQNDPTGYMLKKKDKAIKHICLPGEIKNFKNQVRPKELILEYKSRGGLLDPKRLDSTSLKDMEMDLGQYAYAGQIGQNPTPPGGGMFKVDKFNIIDRMPAEVNIDRIVRFWDKAGSSGGGAYTAGVKIAKLKNGRFIVMDVKRAQWGTDDRERNIKSTAMADEASGQKVEIGIEQEPGSGGKESAENTIRNLAGFSVFKDLPKGNKEFRADPWSVSVNNGDVMLLHGDWNHEFVEEHRYFPYSTYKDQVDACSAAYSRLVKGKNVKVL